MIESITQTQAKIPSSRTREEVASKPSQASDESTEVKKDAVEISEQASTLNQSKEATADMETIPSTSEAEANPLTSGYSPDDFRSLPSTEKDESSDTLRLKPLPSTNLDITA